MTDRYLLFAGEVYYPSGGWSDFKGQFSTLSGASVAGKTLYARSECDWWHVVDLTTLEEIANGEPVTSELYPNSGRSR